MKVDIITHPEFEREFRRLSKKYHSLVDDYAQLI
jgi:mRNA-degrading endonuclease RelE of RelBE toxin-antitoxin system